MPSWMLLAMLSALGTAPAAQTIPEADQGQHEFAPPEQPLPRPPLSAEHLKLGQRLAGLIVVSEIRDEVLRTPPKPPVDDDGNPLTHPRLAASGSAQWNVASAAAGTYAQLYSADELRAMIAFFESPAGQKFVSARRQGVVSVMHVFEQLPWYANLYYELCGGQEFCTWRPAK